MDETTDIYLGFEMNKSEVQMKQMMEKVGRKDKGLAGGADKESGCFRGSELDQQHQSEHHERRPILQRTCQVHPQVA